MIKEAQQAGFDACLSDLGLEKTAFIPQLLGGIGRGAAATFKGIGRATGLMTKTKNMAPLKQMAQPMQMQKMPGFGVMKPGNLNIQKGQTLGVSNGSLTRTTPGWWDKKSTLGKAGTALAGVGAAGSYGAAKGMELINNVDQGPGKFRRYIGQ